MKWLDKYGWDIVLEADNSMGGDDNAGTLGPYYLFYHENQLSLWRNPVPLGATLVRDISTSEARRLWESGKFIEQIQTECAIDALKGGGS